jgi:hypothetical protein
MKAYGGGGEYSFTVVCKMKITATDHRFLLTGNFPRVPDRVAGLETGLPQA